MISTKQTQSRQLSLLELISRGDKKVQNQENRIKDEAEKQQRDYKKALSEVEKQMSLAFPPEMVNYLAPYQGRTVLSEGMRETRMLKIPDFMPIEIRMIFRSGSWDFLPENDQNPRAFESAIRVPGASIFPQDGFEDEQVFEDWRSQNGYEGFDLEMALAVARREGKQAAGNKKTWMQEHASIPKKQIYIPPEGETSSSEGYPFSQEADLYIRKIVRDEISKISHL